MSRLTLLLTSLLFLLPSWLIAQTEISGALEGTLTTGTYVVTSDISVAEGSSLTIQPGSELRFNYLVGFEVNGTLTAAGTEEDTIRFTVNEGSTEWGGIQFTRFASDNSRLEYCWVEYCADFALSLDACSPTIEWCMFQENMGGGIFLDGSDAVIRNTAFYRNSGSMGGGISASFSNPTLEGVVFSQNMAEYGGGFASFFQSKPSISMAVFSENQATEYGGGLYCIDSDSIMISRSIFTDNAATRKGGAIYFEGSEAWLYNATISSNECPTQLGAGGVYVNRTNVRIVNSIIVTSQNYGVFFEHSYYADVRYSEFFNNLVGNFGWDGPTDRTVYYPELENLAGGLRNYRGNVCDPSFNIYMDPQFTNRVNRDYRLSWLSPGIDAGDPTFPTDGGAYIDMGAIPFEPVSVPEEDEHRGGLLPDDFSIVSTYPNPFNSRVTITFSSSIATAVTFEVFDLLGRRIVGAEPMPVNAGQHRISWQADGPAGVYLVRLTTSDGERATARVVYVK